MNTSKPLAAFFAFSLLCISGCQTESKEPEPNATTTANSTESQSSPVKQKIEPLPEKCSEKNDSEKKETPESKAESNGQQVENNDQKPESDKQKPENNDPKVESNEQKPKSDEQKTENSDQEAESNKQKPEDNDQEAEDSIDQANADNQNKNSDSTEETPECYDDFSIEGLEKFLIASANILPYQGIIVDLRDGAPDLNELEKDGGIEVTESDVLAAERTYLVEKKGGNQEISDLELVERIKKFAPYIEYAELNYIYEATTKQPSSSPSPQSIQFTNPNQDSSIPNDPFFKDQPNLHMIKLAEARKISEGEGSTVAVVDSGVIKTSDLSPNRFVKGHDFIDEKPIDSPSDDFNTVNSYHEHGTHIAGSIGQDTNNALGFAGIAPKSKIMPIRVLKKVDRITSSGQKSSAEGDAINIAKGIRWAANNNADVINLSLAIKIGDIPFQERILGRAKNIVIRRALQYAKKKGVTVVAAAGNYGELSVLFPARDENVIAVAAYDKVGNRATYSNYGKGVTVVHPPMLAVLISAPALNKVCAV
jgi:chemotaxis protein histidine kinase CheA